jgi:hypothetical protein
MITRLVLFFAISLSIHQAQGSIISLAGTYHGINLYVENDSIYGGSCVKEIFVNDERVPFDKEKEFFEIDMSFLKLKEQVSIKILCTSTCHVKVLNPEAINLAYGFLFTNLNLELNKIEWVTTNEKPGGKYIVEVRVQKTWVAVGEVSAKSNRLLNMYEKEMEVLKHHYYRVKYLDAEGVAHSSPPINYHKHN